MPAIPVYLFRGSKSAKHDVTLTPLTADLLWPGSYFFDTRCGIVARIDMASFKAKFPVLQELFAKKPQPHSLPQLRPGGTRRTVNRQRCIRVPDRDRLSVCSSHLTVWPPPRSRHPAGRHCACYVMIFICNQPQRRLVFCQITIDIKVPILI